MPDSQYLFLLEQQHDAIDTAASALSAQVPEDAELTDINWSDLAYQAWQAELENEIQQAAYKFFKMSKDDFLAVLSGSGNVQSSRITHTLTQFDTLRGLSLKYGVSADDILLANNVNATEFMALSEVLIPIPRVPDRTLFPDIPTYGSHEGAAVLGKDISADGDVQDGDFKVLDEVTTFKQGILALITTSPGDVPFDESFGATPKFGGDFPPDLTDGMLQIQVLRGLSQDQRIADVDGSIKITRAQTSVTIEMDVRPINGTDLINILA